MQLPFFYIDSFDASQQQLTLGEENSRHIVQVLRMKAGELLHLTDGNGHLLIAEITEAHKKNCIVRITKKSYEEPAVKAITIAISPLKNAGRYEWFLEKATEIGVTEIVPLICSRTEKQKIRSDRMRSILISAMLQSRQTWLPKLSDPVLFSDFISGEIFININQKFIAHCVDEKKEILRGAAKDAVILIGPEGDFTQDEINDAIAAGCTPVTLGNTRLRTETAGMVSAALFQFG